MPFKMQIPSTDDLSLFDVNNPEECSFGKYLRSVRKAQSLSIRQLARTVNRTPTYISDIENGNNKPPDKELLDAILIALHLRDHPRIMEKLYDLAALERNDIPADVKAFIMQNPNVISLLRTLNLSPNKKEIMEEMTFQHFNGGTNDETK